MIPTRPVSRASNAPATRALIGIAVVFFLLTGLGNPRGEVFQTLAQVNFAVEAGEWWRVFTPVLLHASIMHIVFNMWALWVLGPQIERGVGTGPFVGLYLASAAVGGAFFHLLGDPFASAVGASGAIFGLFGVWFNWALRRRNTLYGQVLLRQIGFLLLVNAAIPFLIPGIAWEAHLGGLVAGFVIGEIWSRIRTGNVVTIRSGVTVAVALLAVLAVIL